MIPSGTTLASLYEFNQLASTSDLRGRQQQKGKSVSSSLQYGFGRVLTDKLEMVE